MMIERLVVIGDSWSSGCCGDLYVDDPEFSKNNLIEMKHNDWHFKNPWPVLLSEQLDIKLLNLSCSGCSNMSMVTMLYDSFILGNLNPNKDFVIVLFSTWHRQPVWIDVKTSEFWSFNRRFFPKSCANYNSTSQVGLIPYDQVDKNLLAQLAYEMFFNFYHTVTFLEKNNFKYKIGWAFSFIEDLQPFLNDSYISIMKKNPNLIETMFNLCENLNFTKLYHPNQNSHNNYSKYLYKKLKKEELF